MPSSPNPSRRDFAKSVAAVAVAPLLGGLTACTAAPPPAGPAPAVPPPGGPALPSPAAPAPGPGSEAGEEDRRVEPLLAVVVARHGDRLTPEELEEVRRGIAGNLRAADRLRDFELPISVEPGFPFRVAPGGGR